MENKYTERGNMGIMNLLINEKKNPLYYLNPALSYFHTKEMKTFNNKNFIQINLHKENIISF